MTPALVTERERSGIHWHSGPDTGQMMGDTETSGEWCLDRVISHLLYISHTLGYAIPNLLVSSSPQAPRKSLKLKNSKMVHIEAPKYL